MVQFVQVDAEDHHGRPGVVTPRCYDVTQANIAQTRKQFSKQLILALADYGDMPADSEALLLSKGLHSLP